MHLRPTTGWNPREKKAFCDRYKDGCFKHEQDIANLERYYKAHWPPDRDRNMLRHDLLTMLNNLQGEISRGNIHCEKHPIRVVNKIIPMPPQPSLPLQLNEEDAIAIIRFNEERERRKRKLL